MDVCIVNPGDISRPRGGENRVLAISRALANAGYNVHLVVPKPMNDIGCDFIEDINLYPVNVTTVGGNIYDQFKRAIHLIKTAKYVTKKRNAILQIEHSPLAGLAFFLGVRDYVVDMHDLAVWDPTYDGIPFRKQIFSILECKALLGSKLIFVVTNFMRKYVSLEWNIPYDNIFVVGNGYFKYKIKNFVNLFDENKLRRTSAGYKFLIMFLGTLHRKLDLNKFIQVADYFRDSLLCVVGDGPARNKLEKLVHTRNVRNLSILGWIPDEKLYSLMALADVCILPETDSIHVRASCPVKLFEYGAFGKAIVADDVTEVCKMFGECKAALLSKPSDTDMFIKNIESILENPCLKKKLGYNAKKLSSKYCWENQTKKIVKIYDEYLS